MTNFTSVNKKHQLNMKKTIVSALINLALLSLLLVEKNHFMIIGVVLPALSAIYLCRRWAEDFKNLDND